MKILIIVERSEVNSYRTKRVLKEIKLRKVEVEIIISNEVVFFTDKIFSNNKEVDLDLYKAVYSIGNGTINHYLINFCFQKNGMKIWPSQEHLNMSDKFFEGIFLSMWQIKTPKTVILPNINKEKINNLAEKVGGFPCIIKKVTGSEGRYVGLIKSYQEAIDFLKKFPHPSVLGKKNVILQEYIEESRGSDFRVYCVGNEILGAIRRTAQNNDFRANISLGGTAEQVEISDEMIEYSKKIMKEGKLLFAGIDFIKSNRGFLVLEINTSADFQGFEKATGINVAGKIIDKFLE